MKNIARWVFSISCGIILSIVVLLLVAKLW